MTDKLREAAQDALDLLDNDDRNCSMAALILRAALAEPEPNDYERGFDDGFILRKEKDGKRPWVGLTREELAEIFANCDLDERGAVAHMVEVKLRNKNTWNKSLERELVAEKEWVRQLTNSNARLKKFLVEAQAEIARLKGEAESWEQVFDRTCEHLADAKTELAEAQEVLNDKRKFCYDVEQALDGFKGDYIEIIKELVAAKKSAEPDVQESLKGAEPVAFVDLGSLKFSSHTPDTTVGVSRYRTPFRNYPLYTAPPRREWVGLTKKEVDSCLEEHGWLHDAYYPVIKDIEAKLKEKNK